MDSINDSKLNSTIRDILERLARSNQRLVLAESCTAGLAAAKLGQFSGVSNHWCGSWVTYRDQSKIDWLGIPPATLQEHTAVSSQATEQMALNSLGRTSEADWSAAITGHLGPDAPAPLDGQIYIAIAYRHDAAPVVRSVAHRLTATARLQRQEESVHWLFAELSGAMIDILDVSKD